MALDLIAEFERIVDALEQDGIDYAVCGGIAMAIHGHTRATMDIDILVAPETVDRAVAVAKACGFDIPGRKMFFGLRTSTPREVRRVSKLDPQSGELMALDLMVVAHEYIPVWDAREELPLADRMVRVVSREGLATMKRLAGRPQDLADLAKLEGTDQNET